MAIKVQNSTIIDDIRQVVGVSSLFVNNARPTTVSYGSSFSVVNQETTPEDISFNPSGTRMYVLGNAVDDITEYVLSTPWSVNTASYQTSKEFSVISQVTDTRGLYISPDGQRFYVTSPTAVFQYSTPIPWNLSVGSYTGISTSVSTQMTSARSTRFRHDGTKMYVLDNINDRIYQYTLSTPWVVNTSTYDNVFMSVTNEETGPVGFDFSADGSSLLVIGNTGDDINYYTLPTYWNVGISTFVGIITAVGTGTTIGETDPRGIFWQRDGKKVYIVGYTKNIVYEFNTNSTSRVDIVGTLDVYNDASFHEGINNYATLRSTGDIAVSGNVAIGASISTGIGTLSSKLTVDGVSDLSIINRDNNIQNAYIANNYHYYIGVQDGNPTGVGFNTTGTIMYILGDDGNDITEYALSTPWQVGTASPTGIVTAFTQDAVVQDFKIKPDGTKLFVVGSTNDRVYEYSISTPWNFNTVGFTTYYQLNGINVPSSIEFSQDGSLMIINDRDNITGVFDVIYEYTLTTPWSVNTAVGPNSSFYVGTQETIPYGISLTGAGTTLYVVGDSQDRIFQYNLTTPFDIRTSTYTSKTLITTGETFLTNVYIKPDGTQIFTIGSSSDTVRTYNLSTPYDVSTGTASVTFAVGTQENLPSGLTFKPDGTSMYVVGDQKQIVYQYTLSSPWNVSTAGLTTEYSVNSQISNHTSQVGFSSTGDAMYVSDLWNTLIVQYNLSTPWNVSSVSGVSTAFTFSEGGLDRIHSFTFSENGVNLYLSSGNLADSIYQYTLTTPWNIRTSVYNGSDILINQYEYEVQSIKFAKNGYKLFVAGSGYDRIYQYALTTPYRISTAYYEKNYLIRNDEYLVTGITLGDNDKKLYIVGSGFDTVWQYEFEGTENIDLSYLKLKDDSIYIGDVDTIPVSVYFRPDGKRMFVAASGNYSSTIIQYELSTAWDIRTSVFSKRWRLHSDNFRTLEDSIESMFFRDDGKLLFTFGSDNDTVYTFELSEPWEISSITKLTNSFSVTSLETAPTGLYFSKDGISMYIVGTTSQVIRQYTLSTAWNVSTATFTRGFSVSTVDTGPQGISFSGDGTRLYLVGSTNDRISEYLLSTPWDISTRYSYRFLNIASYGLTVPRDIYVRPDRGEIYVVDSFTYRVYKFSIPSKQIDISSKIVVSGDIDANQNVNVSGTLNAHNAYFEKLGIGTVSNKNNKDLVVNRFIQTPSIGNRTDISKLQYDSDVFFLNPLSDSTVVNNPLGFTFKPDGTKIYIAFNGTIIGQYSCKTPWDVKTASFEKFINLERFNNNTLYDLCFNDTGTKVYIASVSSDLVSLTTSKITELKLDSPWDITSISLSGYSIITTSFGETNEPRFFTGIEFSPDGTRLYGVKSNPATFIFEFVLSTPWDLSTAVKSFVLRDTVDQPIVINTFDIKFNNDGTKLYSVRRSQVEANYMLSEYNLKIAYNLSSAVYSGIVYTLKDYDIVSIFFKPNGKVLYTLSAGNKTITQFNLTGNWDIKTIQTPSNFTYISPDSVTGIRFVDGGTKLITVQGSTSVLNIYLLNKPYDLSSLNRIDNYRYNSQTGEVGQFYDAPEFSPDGLTLFINNYADNSRSGTTQYALKNPYDFTGMTYVTTWIGQFYLSGAVNARIASVALNPDGTKLYELDLNGSIYEHDLKIPWNLSSVRRTDPKYYVLADRQTQSVGFSNDGSRMYILGGSDGVIYEHETTDPDVTYDVRTMGYIGVTTTTDTTTNTRDFTFNNTGNKLYTLSESTDLIYERTLTYSGNIRVSTSTSSLNVSTVAGTNLQPRGFTFKPDGTSLYVVCITNDRVYQIGLTTAFNLSSAGLTTSFSLANYTTQPEKVRFSTDGLQMYVLSAAQGSLGINTSTTDSVLQYNLSTAWRVDTATYSKRFYVGYEETEPRGLEFNPTGTKMFVTGTDIEYVWQYELSIPWDVGTASYQSTTLNIRASQRNTIIINDDSCRSLKFTPDGYTLYFLNYSATVGNQIIYQYDMQVPWKVSTASFTSRYVVNSVINQPVFFGFDINWQTGKLYIYKYAGIGGVFQYKFANYEEDKLKVSQGLEVYGKSKFKNSIEVEGISKFEKIGIGTTSSEYSQLTVTQNANIPYISANELDIINWYQKDDDSFWIKGRNDIPDYDCLPTSIVFNDIGNKMYVCDDDSDTIIQYKLSENWNIKTASLETGLNVVRLDSSISGIAFSTTGYSFYFLGRQNDRVYQYNLNTPFDLSSAGFTTYFSVSSQDLTPQSVGFNTDGTSMYILGDDGNDINQYTLTIPWKVDTAGFTTNTSALTSQDTTTTDIYFKPDGTKVWMLGNDYDTIFEYNLGTAWNINTISYANKSLRVRKTGETEVSGLYFSPDGKNLYFVGQTLDIVWRYKLSTPWDISTATIKKQSTWSFDKNDNLLASFYDIEISSSGHKLYGISNIGIIYEYDLIVPWSVSSAVYTGRYSGTYPSDNNTSHSLKFNPDGTKLYTGGGPNTSKITEYSLSKPWDITTILYVGSMYFASESAYAHSLEFNYDGTKMYVAGFSSGSIIEYDLITPWSVIGARHSSDSFPLYERDFTSENGTTNSVPRSIYFKPDGSRMYWVGDTLDKIYQNDLAATWEVKTSSKNGEFKLPSTNTYGIKFKNDGTQVYTCEYTNKIIYQHNLTTPWDITTISGNPTQYSTVAAPNISPLDLDFNNTGTIMIVCENVTDRIYEYNLSIPWNVSSAVYTGKFFAIPSEGEVRTVQFSTDGKILFIGGTGTARIYKFILDIPWDISSIRPWVNGSSPVFNTPSLVIKNLLSSNSVATGPNYFYISPDGKKLYFLNNEGYSRGITNKVFQTELSIPYDITTAYIKNKGILSPFTFNTTNYIEVDSYGIAFNSNGTRLYISGASRERIHEFELSVPYKIDTASVTSRFISLDRGYFGTETSSPYGLILKKDDTKLYFLDANRSMIWELDLPSKNIEITGKTIIHGDLDVQYKLDANQLEATTATITQTVSVGSSLKLYDTPLTVYGKSDIRTLSNSSKFDKIAKNHDILYVGVQDATPTGVAFSPDGKSMYVVGSTSEEINQYTLSTAWDLKTASFVRVKSLTGITTDVRDITVKPDGTQFYVMDLTPDTVTQLTASTPWDVSTLTSVGSTSLTAQDTSMSGLYIGTGGTTMYTTGYTNDRIYQYTLSTPWTVNTAGFTTQFSIGTTTPANTQPEGIFLNPTETKVYTTSGLAAENRVYEYTLSTPSNVSTASLTTSFSLRQSSAKGIAFNPTGLEFYVCNNNIPEVQKFTLTSAFNLNTIQYPKGYLNLNTDGLNSPYGFYIRPDGRKLFVIENVDASQDIFEYTLSTPWELNTQTLVGIFNLNDAFTDINFKPDGTKMYLVNNNANTTSSVDEYRLTTPWSIATAGISTSFVIGNNDTTPYGITITPDGSRFYICGDERDLVYPYEMTTPWDLRTARRVSEDLSVLSQDTLSLGLAFSSDGSKVYMVGDTANTVYQYNITTTYEWDLRYASYSGISTNLTSQDATPQGITFKSDGTRMWMVGDTNNTIYQYTLATPWDVSTAGLTTSISVSSQTTAPTEIRFSDDGKYVYILDNQNYFIIQFTLNIPWDISSILNRNTYRSFYYPSSMLNSTTNVFTFDISKNGTRLYITNNNGSGFDGTYRTFQFNLSESWNISSASLISSYRHYNDTIKTDTLVKGLVFKPDGTQFSTVGSTNDVITTYKLSIPWEISSAYYDGWWRQYDSGKNIYYGSRAYKIEFNSDGTKVYMLSLDTSSIFEWSLSIPYKLYSGIPNYDFSYNLLTTSGIGIGQFVGFQISPDNERFFVLANESNARGHIYDYKLPTEKINILNNTKISGTIESTSIRTSDIIVDNSVFATTLYADGSNLTRLVTPNTTNSNQPISFASSIPSTSGLGATSLFVFNPSTTRLGIGTTNPVQRFQVGSGSSVVVIDNMGELGIGTTSPIQPFQLGSRTDLVPVLVTTGATIGITTTIITGISTTSITTGLEIVAISGIIATGTTVTGIGSTSVSIGTTTLNVAQQNNVTLTFAARNDGNLVVMTSTGSVGLGTTNPVQKFQINTGSSTLVFTSTGNLGIGTTNPVQRFQVGSGSSVVVIDNMGELGIGTTSPVQSIQVGSGTSTLVVTSTGNLGIGTTNPVQSIQVGSGTSIFVVTNIGSVGIGTTNPLQRLQVGTASSLVSVVVVSNTGNVGLGTTNPRVALDVIGSAIISGSVIISGVTTIANLPISVLGAGSSVGVGGTIGVTTYYGDGSKLTGTISGISISTDRRDLNQFVPYSTAIGSTIALGATTNFVYNPFTARLGIGTTEPLQNLHIQGNLLVAAGSSTGQHIVQKAYELSNGALSWEGTAGQLFSITNNLTSGSIFSVNDITGLPFIDVNANGAIQMGVYGNTNVGLGITNPSQKLDVVGNVRVSGILSSTDTRLNSFSEKSTLISGNTVSIVYNTGGGNIAICTNPTGPITLNVTGIPTDSSFDNRVLKFSVVAIQTSIGYACTAVNLNGVSRTVRYSSGVVSVGSTTSYDIFNFIGINTIGSASTSANYQVLSLLNNNFR